MTWVVVTFRTDNHSYHVHIHACFIDLTNLYRLDDKTYKTGLTKIVNVSVLVRPRISLHFKLD